MAVSSQLRLLSLVPSAAPSPRPSRMSEPMPLKRTPEPDSSGTSSRALERVVTSFRGLLDAASARLRLDPTERDALVQELRIRLRRALGDEGRIGSVSASYIHRTVTLAALDLLRRRRVRERVLVLSACRTAAGEIVGSEGLRGLTAPSLEAGARAIVATQWDVRDATAARLSGDLYRALRVGNPVIDAVRLVRLSARRRGDSSAVWAVLSVIGDSHARPRPASP